MNKKEYIIKLWNANTSIDIGIILNDFENEVKNNVIMKFNKSKIEKPKSIFTTNGIYFSILEVFKQYYDVGERVYSHKYGCGIVTISSKELIVVQFEDIEMRYEHGYFFNLSRKEYTKTQNKIRKFIFNLNQKLKQL